MIIKDSFSPERIASFRKKPDLNKSDPAIIEKMIRALALLEHLSVKGIDFIFKGGTCLILLLDKPNRFSIDIDILTSVSRDNLEKILDTIITTSEFKYYKLDEKRSYKTGIPKAHYKFYWSDEPTDYILLDVLYENHNYPEIISMDVKTEWLLTEEPYHPVYVPTKESILGDKLTAFAPNTTGVPYGKNKETEIIKQLYDVSILIDEIQDINKVNEAFISIAKNEIKYRKSEITPEDILNDIIDTALLLSRRERNTTELDRSKYNELQSGFRSFNNFLIRGKFRIESAIEASAKVAWFATKLKESDFSPITKFNDRDKQMELTNADERFRHLNKLKRSNKVAYYYWWHCINSLK